MERNFQKQTSMQEMFDKRRVSLKKLAAKQTRPVQPVAPRPEAFIKSPHNSPGQSPHSHTWTIYFTLLSGSIFQELHLTFIGVFTGFTQNLKYDPLTRDYFLMKLLANKVKKISFLACSLGTFCLQITSGQNSLYLLPRP